jgi:ribonuclease P protein component
VNGYPRAARIKKRWEFVQFKTRGTKLNAKHFLLIFTPSSSALSRLGITVSRKTIRNSVDRNRVKRRLRETFRKVREHLTRSIDLLIIVRREAEQCSFQETEHEVLKALQRARLLES